MQQKLCLWLCAAVLLGALSLGNPFLPCPSATPAAGSAGPSPFAASAAAPAGTVESVPGPARGVFALDARVAPAGAAATPHRAGHLGSAAPATPVSARAALAVDASSSVCPDATLQPLVVAVERTTDGEPIWVLRDGRRLVRHPDPHGKPLLVPVDAFDR